MTFSTRVIKLLSVWVFVFFGLMTGLLILNSIYLMALLPVSFILFHIIVTAKAARYNMVNINFQKNGYIVEYYYINNLIMSTLILYSKNQIEFVNNAIGISTLKGSYLKVKMNGLTLEQYVVGKWNVLELKSIETTYNQKVLELDND